MNSSNLKSEKRYIKICLYLAAVILLLGSKMQAWEVDFSRRANDLATKSSDVVAWPSAPKIGDEFLAESPLKQMFTSLDVGQVIALLQTEEGFVPNTLRLKRDTTYKIHIVNVNEKFKNTSFILDAFGQSFGTYFGKTKSFELAPKVSGTFTFISPETGAQGKIIVFSDKETSTPLAFSPSENKK